MNAQVEFVFNRLDADAATQSGRKLSLQPLLAEPAILGQPAAPTSELPYPAGRQLGHRENRRGCAAGTCVQEVTPRRPASVHGPGFRPSYQL
jgi:hypothetical protein